MGEFGPDVRVLAVAGLTAELGGELADLAGPMGWSMDRSPRTD
jgi:hypothetical protein